MQRYVVADVDLGTALSHGLHHDAEYLWKLIKYQLDRAGKYFSMHAFDQASQYLDLLESNVANFTSVVDGQVWHKEVHSIVQCDGGNILRS